MRLFKAVLLCAAVALWGHGAFAQGYCPSASPKAKVITVTTYTIGQADYCQVLTFNSVSPVAVYLPAPGTHGGYNAGYWVKLFMEGSGSLVVTPLAAPVTGAALTINGASSLSLATTKSATIYQGTDGKWYATYSGG